MQEVELNSIQRNIRKFVLLFRVYSIPLLVLFLGFGIYYMVFELTHYLKKEEVILVTNSEIKKYEDGVVRIVSDNATTNPPRAEELPSMQSSPLAVTPQAPNLDIIESGPAVAQVATEHDGQTQSIDSNSKVEPIMYVVQVNSLNVRQEPTRSAMVVASKSRDTVLSALEKVDGWIRIEEGWVSQQYVKPIQKQESLANLAETNTSSANIEGVVYVVGIAVMNIREKPSIHSPITVKKKRGEELVALAEVDYWILTAEGWAYKPLLKVKGES
ncbi:hypothetical protein CCZ01_01425 [Helicobacter monodelphidis]|uniref:SH3 domain-containing protein n=1 Tax=Helicobacter sp. 15-1451 TaxID=2004995 RepID=UPI000DCDDF07|nr:SH3 domain-containing protein [Helicobacter sp. 15-1451]RAX58884.1 hypothetical protein CCZ01_01425 [Helicobacter sp. 15-1451]